MQRAYAPKPDHPQRPAGYIIEDTTPRTLDTTKIRERNVGYATAAVWINLAFFNSPARLLIPHVTGHSIALNPVRMNCQ